MDAIVTGGAGFIGSHVADALLARGDRVVVVDNLAGGRRDRLPEAAELPADRHPRPRRACGACSTSCSPRRCSTWPPRPMCACRWTTPASTATSTCCGTIEVLEAARSTRRAGGVLVHRRRPLRRRRHRSPRRRRHRWRRWRPYGTSKYCAEQYLGLYNRLYGSNHVILRYGNVYGPRQDPHGEAGVVAIFFGRLARARRR